MRHYTKLIILLLSQTLFLNSWGQEKKLALEQIQAYSTIQPAGKYWKLPTDINPILNALDTGILLKLGLQRDTSIVTKTLHLNKPNQLGKININWEATRDFDYHAYLELYEMEPLFLLKNKIVALENGKVDSMHSCWLVTISIFNKTQKKVLQKTIVLGLTPISSLGIGYANQASASTPYHIYNAITKSISLLSPEREDVEYMDAKLPTAYTTDNYWMPYVHNQSRILLDTTKKFINIITPIGSQLLRTPAAIINKINLKDRSPNNPYNKIIALVKKNRSGYFNNEYYQIIQPLRDVKNNIDYTAEGFIEFNAEGSLGMNQLALVFLPDTLHKIYKDKDSIGYFLVKDLVTEKDKYYYPEIIYNGVDSTKQYALSDKLTDTKFPIIHTKSIEGKINNTPFAIKLSANNTIKTIFINDTLIAILAGKEKPTHLVMVDKSAAVELTNLLIMLSFSEIFQNPN
jgi:hypothetical protein